MYCTLIPSLACCALKCRVAEEYLNYLFKFCKQWWTPHYHCEGERQWQHFIQIRLILEALIYSLLFWPLLLPFSFHTRTLILSFFAEISHRARPDGYN